MRYGRHQLATLGLLAVAVLGLYIFASYSKLALHRASARGDTASVRRLAAAQAHRINQPSGLGVFFNYTGNCLTPLMWAARYGHANAMSELIAAGSDVNQEDQFGRTALWMAVESGSLSCIELLLGSGANPNGHTYNGDYVLHAAARRGDLATVSRLLAAGADPNTVGFGPHEGLSALWEAADRGHVDLVRELLRHGADPRLSLVGDESFITSIRVKQTPAMREIQALLLDHQMGKQEDK